MMNIDIYILFCFVCWTWFRLIVFLPKEKKNKKKKGKQGLIYIYVSISYIPNLSSSHFFPKLRKPQIQVQSKPHAPLPRSEKNDKDDHESSHSPPGKNLKPPRQCHRVANVSKYIPIHTRRRTIIVPGFLAKESPLDTLYIWISRLP